MPRILQIGSDGTVRCLGSCFVCAPLMVVMAQHVFNELISQDPTAKLLQKDTTELRFDSEIWIVQDIVEDGHVSHFNVWYPHTYYPVPDTDLAVVTLTAHCENAAAYTDWKCMPISVIPPKKGDAVTALGVYEANFEGTTINDDGKVEHIATDFKEAASDGKVIEVFPSRRDQVILPYPCFRADIRIESGMSGGPVINERSEIVGMNTSSFDYEESHTGYDSYFSLMWPLLLANVNFDQFSESPIRGVRPLVDLARTDALSIVGLERITDTALASGGRRITLKVEEI